ncbi:hypothetical protein [Alkalihalobacterium alkalinitrilicum]|uniref:hypothetical protein n=1 Tax=Alkalihalobacterium alkalinitrilicum TaxID=427920 RepID=UPI00099558B2|nr:hypothetical protein [Alkalihalobacterium alkalinitrilicum]
MKQWFLVIIAATSFVAVWTVVLFQLITTEEPVVKGRALSIVERNFHEKQKLDQVVWLKDRNTPMENSNIRENPSLQMAKVDLRKVDFSDVDSIDGVPIDIILKRLEIE